MNFKYYVRKESVIVAGFHNKIDAENYRDLLRSIARSAGYTCKVNITDTPASLPYLVTKNEKEIAGFIDFIHACDYKNLLIRLYRPHGYGDRFRILSPDCN